MTSAGEKEVALQLATEWLVRLDAEEVEESTRAAFFAWLGASEVHQQAYIDMEKMWGDLAVVERLGQQALEARGGWFSWLQRPLGALAGLLAVGVGLLLSLQLLGPTQQQYVTATGQRAEFLLDDGSRLHINTDSEVLVSLQHEQRLLELTRGEAYFDVAPDPDRPLVVQTAGGLVRVLGTRFNIRRDVSGSTITVEEGLVAVVPDSRREQVFEPMFEADVTLSAAQQTILSVDQSIAAPVAVDSEAALAWREGRLVYDGVPLERVIADINRYFPGTIKLDDPSLADMEVVGMLNLQNRSATLAALEATFNVQAVQVSNQLTVIRARPE